jgi:uncharacterized protein (TIGR03437 family)
MRPVLGGYCRCRIAAKRRQILQSTTGADQVAALTSGFVGLYQVNFVVPELPAGYLWRCGMVNSNLTVSIGRKTSFDGAGICVVLPGEQ